MEVLKPAKKSAVVRFEGSIATSLIRGLWLRMSARSDELPQNVRSLMLRVVFIIARCAYLNNVSFDQRRMLTSPT